MQHNATDLRVFQETVWDYFHDHGRQLPWREPEPDGSFSAYKILVSEFMLQQTQVNRVVPKFQEFIASFPTISSLADASLGAVLTTWSGLGYNRRAKFLHQTVQHLVTQRDTWKYEDLVACPGIGVNTAGAILAYTYNQPVIFIETNVRTVYIHHFFSPELPQTAHFGRKLASPMLTVPRYGSASVLSFHPKLHDSQKFCTAPKTIPDSVILELVADTLDREQPRQWYWALMDYGSHLKTTVGNANRASETYTRQSTFQGSRRQLRGQVIRLLAVRKQTPQELMDLIPDQRLETVLHALAQEELIIRGRIYCRLA